MAGVTPGKRGTYHSEHGDVPCWVIEYEAGRDGGDHHVGGFTSAAQHNAGQGDVFRVWTTVGDKQGEFTPA